MIEQNITKLAFLIDNQVMDILHTDSRLASILLSDPLVIDVSSWYDEPSNKHKRLNDAYYNLERQKFKLPDPGAQYIFNDSTYEWEYVPPLTPMPVEEGRFFK